MPTTVRRSRFSRSYKKRLERQRWKTREDLGLARVIWIEKDYHRKRGRGRLGPQTSIELENINRIAQAAWTTSPRRVNLIGVDPVAGEYLLRSGFVAETFGGRCGCPIDDAAERPFGTRRRTRCIPEGHPPLIGNDVIRHNL